MKRTLCWILALMLLMAVTGCHSPAEPDLAPPEAEYQMPDKIAYTEFPATLKAYPIGTLDKAAGAASAGGLYYAENGKYGIKTPDGKQDTGAVYTLCRPFGDYFMISQKQQVLDVERMDGLNIIGIVDATGKEIVPLTFAQVSEVDSRFVRAVTVTGLAKGEEDRITYFVGADGEQVSCAGTWQLYDLQTGQAVPDAVGTSRYAAYSYGSYVKYVTDDEKVVIATPDGKSIPEEAEHLKNGYYYLPSDRTVYDGNMTPMFTVEADGYIPCNSEGVSAYIVAKKQVNDSSRYVLLDLEGNAVTADYAEPPVKVGQLLCAEGNMMDAAGTVVAGDSIESVKWESVFGYGWMVKRLAGTTLMDAAGQELYTTNDSEVQVDRERMLFYKKGENSNTYYSYETKDFTIEGSALAPWLIRATREDGTFDLVNPLASEPLLSGCKSINGVVAADDRVYIYAEDEEGAWTIYVVA